MNEELYEEARKNSVNYSRENEQERMVPLTKKKTGLSAFKKALITGLVFSMLTTSIALVSVNLMKKGATDYSNRSFDTGYSVVVEDKGKVSPYAFSYEDAAVVYSDDMDFDSFVYGAYSKMRRIDSNLLVPRMNNLFYWLNVYGYTEYTTFEEYCIDKGYCKEDKSIDLDAYKKGSVEYLRVLKEEGSKTLSEEESQSLGK